jgi:hypothetical protein
LGILIAWLGLRWTPSWYDPPQVQQAELPRVRASLPNSLQTFTDQLVAGKPFQFRLSARTVNEWIAARESIWPDTEGRLPEWLHEPVIAFENGRIIAAGRFEREGWEAIVSLHWVVEPQNDDLLVRLVKTGVGAFGAPRDRITEALDQWLGSLPPDAQKDHEYIQALTEELRGATATQLVSDGVRVANDFEWPNGEREFRLTKISADDGWLTLGVEPL